MRSRRCNPVNPLRVSVAIVVLLVFSVGLVAGTAVAQDTETITVTDDPTTDAEVSDIHSGLEHVADGGEIYIDPSYDSVAEPEFPITIDQPVTITGDPDHSTTVAVPSDTQPVFEIISSDVEISSLEITTADDLTAGDAPAITIPDTGSVADVELADITIAGTYPTGFAAYASVDELTVRDSQFSNQGDRAIVVDSAVDAELTGNTIDEELAVVVSTDGSGDSGLSVQENTFATEADLVVNIDSDTSDLDSVVLAENSFSSSTHVDLDLPDSATGQVTLAPNWWGDQYGPDITDISDLTNPQHTIDSDRNAATLSATNTELIELTPWYTGDDLSTDTAPVENADRTYLSIQPAIDEASAGDEIQVHEGEFHSRVSADKPLEVTGKSSKSKLVGSITMECSGGLVSISNLHITNSSYHNDNLVHVDNLGGNVVFSNNHVEGYSKQMIQITNGDTVDVVQNQFQALQSPSNATAISLIDNDFSSLADNSVTGYNTGIVIQGKEGMHDIYENKIHDNDIGLHLKSGLHFEIERNNFLHNSEAALVISYNNPAIDASDNWWNSSDGPDINGNGDGDRIVAEYDASSDFDDFASIISIREFSSEVDILGVEHDPAAYSEEDIHFTGQDIMYDPQGTGEPQPASGIIVIEIAGVEFTGELDSGSVSNLTITDPTESFDATKIDSGEANITIPHTDIGTVGSVTLLHEVYQPAESGYVPISIPQPSALYFDQTDPHTVTWNSSIEEYQSVDLPANTGRILTSESLNEGLYFHFSDDDVRYGFSYATEPTEAGSSIDVSLKEGWNLVSTNHDVTSGETMDLNRDLSGIDIPDSDTGYSNADIVVYAADSTERLYADSTISGHDLYWIYVEEGTTPEDRTIQTPVYDPDPGG